MKFIVNIDRWDYHKGKRLTAASFVLKHEEIAPLLAALNYLEADHEISIRRQES